MIIWVIILICRQFIVTNDEIGFRICNAFDLLIFSELLIPPTANVYYAVSTQHDLNFVLREKHEDINDCLGQDTSVVDPLHTSTPKSGPRKGSRDTSKARRKLLGLQL